MHLIQNPNPLSMDIEKSEVGGVEFQKWDPPPLEIQHSQNKLPSHLINNVFPSF